MKVHAIDREMLISFAKGQLSREESLQVLAGVEADADLSRELEEVLLLIRGIEDAQGFREGGGRSGRVVRERWIRYLLRTAAVLVLAFMTAITVSEVGKDRSFYLARIDEIGHSTRLRGIDGDQIDAARREFMSGHRDAAIREMERLANVRPEGESVGVLHMLLGEMLLCSAERSYLGLFPWYDGTTVLRGMEHLDMALKAGDNQIAEEVHWFRLKGFLMLGDRAGAVREGTEILRIGKNRIAEVRDALQQIAVE